MKIISFSVWGDVPMYDVGMEKNIELACKYYPDWNVVVHAPNGYRAFEGAIMEYHEPEPGYMPLFWRMSSGINFDAIIIRDADSRLGIREKSAVNEWLADGSELHIMRTHPNHTRPIMGGLWGYHGDIREIVNCTIDKFKRCMSIDRENYRSTGWIPHNDEKAFFNADQCYLADEIYPVWCKNATIHDDNDKLRPLPIAPENEYDFPGNKYNEYDIPLYSLNTR